MPMGRPRNTIARIMERVDTSAGEDACWPWLGPLNKGGYGFTPFAGKTEMTHRIVYAHFVGPIPAGMTIDHLCFTTACQNPKHMAVVTRSENSNRRRTVATDICSQGHDLTVTARPMAGGRYCSQCNAEARAARKAAVEAGESFTPSRDACRRGHPQESMRQSTDGYWRCIECRRIADAEKRQHRRATRHL